MARALIAATLDSSVEPAAEPANELAVGESADEVAAERTPDSSWTVVELRAVLERRYAAALAA